MLKKENNRNKLNFMRYIKALVICSALFFSSLIKGKEMPSDAKTTFVAWNQATLTSLRTHIRLSKDVVEKKVYQNRLATIKGYLSIKDNNSINSRSIRFQFLEKLKYDGASQRDFTKPITKDEAKKYGL